MKAIAVFSVKGGVGKSAVAVNLAYAAATAGGRRTLLWDLDSQGAATYLLRLTPKGTAKARAALAGEVDLAGMALGTDYPNLDLLPADRSLRRVEGDLAQSERLKLLKRHLKALGELYDRVVIDCPPGLSELADRLFRAVDLVVVPLLPSPLSERGYEQLKAELLKQHAGRPPLVPVWSMVDRRRKLHRETVDRAPGRIAIPYSAAIESMAVHQAPIGAIQPASDAARAFATLWAEVEPQLLRR
jgi:cellulose biosynthesis protein BcsQ